MRFLANSWSIPSSETTNQTLLLPQVIPAHREVLLKAIQSFSQRTNDSIVGIDVDAISPKHNRGAKSEALGLRTADSIPIASSKTKQKEKEKEKEKEKKKHSLPTSSVSAGTSGGKKEPSSSTKHDAERKTTRKTVESSGSKIPASSPATAAARRTKTLKTLVRTNRPFFARMYRESKVDTGTIEKRRTPNKGELSTESVVAKLKIRREAKARHDESKPSLWDMVMSRQKSPPVAGAQLNIK